MFKDFLALARPKQWAKNLILFAGLIFSTSFLDPLLIGKAVLAFVIFCLLSATVYTVNDIFDIEQDKNHPVKKNRPLAAGRLSISQAVAFAAVLLSAAVALSFLENLAFQIVALGYVVLISFYSLGLKKIPILDVIIISVGFVLRAIAGSVIIPGLISPWLLMCAFLLSLVLGFGKRRHELVLLNTTSGDHRQVLTEYSADLLDAMILIAAASTLMAYSMYTFEGTHTRLMMATVPIVTYGIFRYFYLVHIRGEGGSPEQILLHDRPIAAAIGLWAIVAMVILYLEKTAAISIIFR